MDVCTTDLWRSEEAIGAPGIGVMDDVMWLMLCGYWEPNLGPLQEQALLNTEPHLQEYSVLIIFLGIAEFES